MARRKLRHFLHTEFVCHTFEHIDKRHDYFLLITRMKEKSYNGELSDILLPIRRNDFSMDYFCY
jgi:hypothetical protein